MSLGGAPAAAKPVLEKVLADNPSKDLKGMAAYALGTMAFEKEDGKGAKEAEAYFERVQKEFADVKGPRGGTLADMAKGNLFELKHLAIGMKAPAAESKTLDGKKTSLVDHAGKVVVLDIWATWCGPCRAMIPHEREMVEKFKDKPFALICVSADDEKKELEDFLAKEKMPWTHWWDDGGEAAAPEAVERPILPDDIRDRREGRDPVQARPREGTGRGRRETACREEITDGFPLPS